MNGVLVTGGAGFIGSTVVRSLLARGERVVVLDALTYSGRRENLAELFARRDFTFVPGSIGDGAAVSALLAQHRPRAVLNLAAETHVDRSIDRPADFVLTNVNGLHAMLEASLDYWRGLPAQECDAFRFVQISTDEVYGSIAEGASNEDSALSANSPYAATKAAGDMLVRAYQRTYGLPVLVTRGCNAYGPRQFPEKLIPLLTLRGLSGLSLPIYGDGRNVREWIHVDDAAAGILAALDRGEAGAVYNLGSGMCRENVQVAQALCGLVDRVADEPLGTTAKRIEFVTDRPGHDRRYSMESSKAAHVLGWRAGISFEDGLARTIDWYVANRDWWLPVTRDRYDLSRLGALSALSR